MKSLSHLLAERHGAVLWLTINRPQRRNALTVELVGDLADALVDAGRDPEVRAVVLTGSGDVFCSGGDLTSLSAIAEAGGARGVTDVIYAGFQRLVRTLGEVSVPVVAAVNGAALGAGLDLALACDLRVASSDAVFASSWIGVGLVPGMGGAHLLTRAIGTTRATEMVLLGRTIDSDVALAWGVVNRVVPSDELGSAVTEMVTRLSGLSAPGVASSKASLRRAGSLGFENELAVLGAVQGGLLVGDDFKRASARFRK